jgi:hypothetical protein
LISLFAKQTLEGMSGTSEVFGDVYPVFHFRILDAHHTATLSTDRQTALVHDISGGQQKTVRADLADVAFL